MSIIDHQPKYAKLRTWRETYRQKMAGEYRRYIEKGMRPPDALSRQVYRDWRVEDGMLPMLTPMCNLIPRIPFPGQHALYKFKPIRWWIE